MMEILTNEQKANIASELFKNLVTVIMSVDDLYKDLDSLLIEYAKFLIEENECGHPKRAEKLFTIYQLMKICQLVDVAA